MSIFFQPQLSDGSLLTYLSSDENAENKHRILIRQIKEKLIPFDEKKSLEIKNIRSAIKIFKLFLIKSSLQSPIEYSNMNTYTITQLKTLANLEKGDALTDSEILIALFLLKIPAIYEDNVWKFNQVHFALPKNNSSNKSKSCSIL